MSFMFVLKNWDRSVSIVAVRWAGQCRARFLVVTVIFIFFRMSTLILEPTQPPVQDVVGAVHQRCCMKLTTNICLLRLHRAVTSAPLYNFMAWTETAVPLAFTV